MNAILLVGDRAKNPAVCRPLLGMNKAFLSVEGWPLLVHVLAALNGASRVDTLFIIGPQKQIMETLEKALPVFLFTKKIEVLDQKESLMENIYTAYGRTLGIEASEDSKAPPPALFLPSDIPLVTSSEIDAMIAGADMDRYDYCLGVTSAAHLERFYPTRHQPGIKMPYLYLRDQAYRINNLHIARLSTLTAGPLFQTMYNCRHQKNLINRLKMIGALLIGARQTKAFSLYLRAQAATLSVRLGFHRLATLFRRTLVLSEIEREFSLLFNMRFKVLEINEGGAALDIDDETTYQTMASMFLHWHDEMSAPVTQKNCPFKAICPERVS